LRRKLAQDGRELTANARLHIAAGADADLWSESVDWRGLKIRGSAHLYWSCHPRPREYSSCAR